MLGGLRYRNSLPSKSPTSLFKAMVVKGVLRGRLGAERMEDQHSRVTQASEVWRSQKAAEDQFCLEPLFSEQTLHRLISMPVFIRA